MNEPGQPPEALLIERLREARVPKLSVTRAAKAAGISESRWRQIAKGYQQATKETRLAVVAPAETLARMAVVVGASPEELREAGRDDAADYFTSVEEPVPSAGANGGEEGFRAAMRRRRILDKPQAERSADEVGWLAAYDEMHPRKLDPSIYPTGERRAFEAIFGDWQQARARMLNLTLEYAATRKIAFDAAEKELPHVLEMATDVSSGTGRPWTPPWNPGPQFREGDEPWKRNWWPYRGETSPYNLGIHQVGGPDWEIGRVHENRKRAAKEQRVWNDHRKVTLAADERGLAVLLRTAEYWARDSGIDWGAFNRRFLKLLQDNAITSLDDVKRALADLVPAADDLTPAEDDRPPTGDQHDYDLVRRDGDSEGQALRDSQDRDAHGDSAVEELLRSILTDHYRAMVLSARESSRQRAMVLQATERLKNHDPDAAIEPEVTDVAYAQFAAARLSGVQGGNHEVLRAMSLSNADAERAQARYDREFAELITFGHVRTVGLQLADLVEPSGED